MLISIVSNEFSCWDVNSFVKKLLSLIFSVFHFDLFVQFSPASNDLMLRSLSILCFDEIHTEKTALSCIDGTETVEAESANVRLNITLSNVRRDQIELFCCFAFTSRHSTAQRNTHIITETWTQTSERYARGRCFDSQLTDLSRSFSTEFVAWRCAHLAPKAQSEREREWENAASASNDARIGSEREQKIVASDSESELTV